MSSHRRWLSAWPRRRLLLGGVALCLGRSVRLKGDAVAPENPVLLWNAAFIEWIKAQTPPPALNARLLAILHLALWRVAREIAENDSREATVATALHAAGHEVCLTLFPSLKSEIDARLTRSGSQRVPSAAENRSAIAARRIARHVIESRAADGSSTTVHYIPKSNPGQWRRTPAANRPPELPHWGKVRPFLAQSANQFRPPPPPDINSKEFLADLQEVRELGSRTSTRRTPEETEIARFWSDFSYTTSPPGHWNDIARAIAAPRLNPVESARLFALLNVAMADVGIATWECKYHFNFWRPITALSAHGDAGWSPLLASPPHPEYVSGHSAFSGAAAAVIEAFFGTDAVSFSASSDTVKETPRHFRNVHECAAEISRSRVLGGIHFSTSCHAGLALGRRFGASTVRAFEK